MDASLSESAGREPLARWRGEDSWHLAPWRPCRPAGDDLRIYRVAHSLSEGFVALVVVGAGAWLGAEAAYLFGQAGKRRRSSVVGAALIGAVSLSVAWRRLHPAEPLQSGDPAAR